MMICPLTDKEIDPVDCLENIDITDGFISDESHLPEQYKKKDGYLEICMKCKYHESMWENQNTAE